MRAERDPLFELGRIGERLDSLGPLAWSVAALVAGTSFVLIAAITAGPLGLVAAAAPVVLIATVALLVVHGVGRLLRPWLLRLPGTRPGMLMQDQPGRSCPLQARGYQRRRLATTHGPDGVVVLGALLALFVSVGAVAAIRAAASDGPTSSGSSGSYEEVAGSLVTAARTLTASVAEG